MNSNDMVMVDRYIYAVSKRLPEKLRADVEKELRANIADMLPEPHNAEDIEKVLYELGNPAVIAEEYQDRKRYLISPALYGNYIYFLKLAAGIAATVVIIESLITTIIDGHYLQALDAFTGFFVRLFSGAFKAAFQVFTWVTISFAIADRVGAHRSRLLSKGREWSVRSLEPVPKAESRIKTGESVVSIIFTALFAILICFFSDYLGIYTAESGSINVTPVFNYDELRHYIPFILVLSALSIFISILKLIYQSWNIKLAILNTVHNILSAALVLLVILNKAIISESFKAVVSDYAGLKAGLLSSIASWSITAVAIIAVLSAVWDSLEGFKKARKRI